MEVSGMPDILVRDVPEWVIDDIKRQADLHGISFDQEVREIVEDIANEPDYPELDDEQLDDRLRLLRARRDAKYAARRALVGARGDAQHSD
jgi:hypothetical protein